MAYDEKLAARVREVLAGRSGLIEKKMFGGIGYLLDGNMACGVHGESLIVRVGPEDYQEALDQPNVGFFDITGRPMTGWVMVGPAGTQDEKSLERWVELGAAYALSLPAK